MRSPHEQPGAPDGAAAGYINLAEDAQCQAAWVIDTHESAFQKVSDNVKTENMFGVKDTT